MDPGEVREGKESVLDDPMNRRPPFSPRGRNSQPHPSPTIRSFKEIPRGPTSGRRNNLTGVGVGKGRSRFETGSSTQRPGRFLQEDEV